MNRPVSSLGEIGLIRRITKRLPRSSSVLIGIGDDAAVLKPIGRERLLFASDMLVEGTHFRLSDDAPQWIGWKALARTVSDVAAMGGQPTHAVISLGLPSRTPVRLVDGIYGGLARCAKRFGIAIVGGDTVRAPCLVIDVAMIGSVSAAHLVLRRGAKVGDRIMVTGRLGGALRSGRHARFVPRLREAQWLVTHVDVHAMIDVSDGLATDLWHLARASGVTMQIRERALPIAPFSTRRQALVEGEDFELLLTVSARQAQRMPDAIGRLPLTEIGRVIRRGVGVLLERADGRVVPLAPEGFRHL